MWIIVGLGNPGKEYEQTRHNLGFIVLDEIAKRLRARYRKSKKYLIAEGFMGTEKVVLVKPSTFMNLSGEAVSEVLAFYKTGTEELVVIHDDLDMAPGSLKIKKGGGSGGHKGVQSVATHLGGSEFLRIKIGIGKPRSGSTEGFVLGRLSAAEMDAILPLIPKAADAVEVIVREGYSKAMTVFNYSAASA